MEHDQRQYTEDTPGSIKKLFEEAEEYGRTSLELLKLKALDISSELLSLFLSRLIIVFILLICLFILSMGIAFWAGDMLGNTSYGFFVVGGFYALVLLVLYLFLGRHIKRCVSSFIIRQVLK